MILALGSAEAVGSREVERERVRAMCEKERG
jgi:hypothetical protein